METTRRNLLQIFGGLSISTIPGVKILRLENKEAEYLPQIVQPIETAPKELLPNKNYGPWIIGLSLLNLEYEEQPFCCPIRWQKHRELARNLTHPNKIYYAWSNPASNPRYITHWIPMPNLKKIGLTPIDTNNSFSYGNNPRIYTGEEEDPIIFYHEMGLDIPKCLRR